MKKQCTLFILMLAFSFSFAQNGINYKALIKDNNGNVVANSIVVVEFSILQSAAQTLVYKETHSPATDANGLIILNIGEGTPTSGTFANIDWSSDTTFLNTKINNGSGLVDMGTTEFKSVPYAITAQTASNVSGLEAIDEGTGIGWRLKGRNPQHYGNIGRNSVDLSFNNSNSTTHGATGYYSIAMGEVTTASGVSSTAMGYGTTASGNASIAMGEGTTASGGSSTAMGRQTTASGYASTAMGYGTRAASYNSVALGWFNMGSGGSPTTWVDTDPLLEVGNGTNFVRSNALTILKNGKVGIGTATPSTFLQVTKGSNVDLTAGTGYVLIGQENGPNVVFDDNEIQARSNGVASTLFLQHRGGSVWAGGQVVHSSDRRLKKDITTLPYGLETILKLNPVTYNWKDRVQDHKSLGLIAQDVQSIINEIVNVADDADKTLSISYTELIPVLIKAIQEQQKIIEDQKKENISQQSELSSLNTDYKALLSRIEILETNISN